MGAHADTLDKELALPSPMRRYTCEGVREYWPIDPEAQTVEVLFLEASRHLLVVRRGPEQSAASRLLPGFEVSVNGLFQV